MQKSTKGLAAAGGIYPVFNYAVPYSVVAYAFVCAVHKYHPFCESVLGIFNYL